MQDAARRQFDLGQQIHRAPEQNELRLWYQPIVELESGRPIGCEALLRWNHPDRGMISPAEFIPLADWGYAEFFAITTSPSQDPDDLFPARESGGLTVLDRYDDGALVEFSRSTDCPAVFLAERGALPQEVYGDDGVGRIVAEVPPGTAAGYVTAVFLDAYPAANLVGEREQATVTPMFGHRTFQGTIEQRLTERQQEVLLAAHEAGYYEWPRDRTSESLAGELDIAAPTLHKHLRTAEQQVVAALFADPNPAPVADDRVE